ncbi:uncharacterized protein LOC132552401 [Ylistrum balloti]|uniref:uncharacterized protein LOC132552401 n=1 Tax=Ylistrum balloti TaxID=509963 RepID=UPI002905D016|nr:uncharacterized protein LOC132552401 [Ylistrum balloti]
MYVMWVKCQNDGCLVQENEITTDVRHVCLGARELAANGPSEVDDDNSDGFTLRERLRRLRVRASMMYRSLRSLKIHYLLRRLEQDYVALTTVTGVLKQMSEDGVHSPEMTEASVSVQNTICELFLTILKIRQISDTHEQLMESHVSGNGLYNGVIPWCTVRNILCQEERNYIILTHLVHFGSLLRYNIRLLIL